MCHETAYQALHVQGRGEPRREPARTPRAGRAAREPRRPARQRQPRQGVPMVMTGVRPAGGEDRAVPGRGKGGPTIGEDQAPAIGALVGRTTRYVMPVHLPAECGGVRSVECGGVRSAESMRAAPTEATATLPARLNRSLTGGQGGGTGRHHGVGVAADPPVRFRGPAGPWRRDSTGNTGGLPRRASPREGAQSTAESGSTPSPPDSERRPAGMSQPSASLCFSTIK
ncbi:hypothetical protein [Streptosporangium minutum]|uniref:Uncharacterized protein n=1 Tax=Streptosporangium minutum TaxID=569862 RepID=A0A243QZU1_9ACTN|nr:hypothetical protein [Streptosporangium minutum]OUC87683.1 hypothetical protein CA984_38160 [Streptosporangium minutum]